MKTDTQAPLVLFTDVRSDPTSERALEAADIAYRYATATDPASLAREGKDADAIVNGFTVIDAGVLSALPRLRLVALTSMGTDMIDLHAAREHGVIVTAIPAETAVAEVAAHAFALMLAVLRNVVVGNRAVRAGNWADYAPTPFPRIGELTLGVIGLGRIGRVLAGEFGRHFGRVLGCDPAMTTAPDGVELVDQATLLASSDVLSVHVPLTDATRHAIGRAEFAAMRPGVIIINVSRGAVLDEAALLEALDAGIVAAAALDVLEHEPPLAEHPLLHHPSVLLTPHIAYHSEYSERRYLAIPVGNVIALTRSARLEGIITGGAA